MAVTAPAVAAAGEGELGRAQRRVAELERKIGQQQVDLVFFRRALRHVREGR
jgi:transposase